MTQQIYNRENVRFVQKEFNHAHRVMVPTWSRLPDVPEWYEPKRCFSMQEHLKKGDILFDIGVADGWVSAIYAQFVGAENMCLFEPTWEVWANIKAIWDANNLAKPMHTFYGFVGDTVIQEPERPHHVAEYKDGWPISAFNTELMEEMTFRSLLSTGRNIPQTTIDDFCANTKIVPDGISIDVEGAELLVLRGAEQTLRKWQPMIWLSLHDVNGALTYDYHVTRDDVWAFLASCGYQIEYLETYGDSHWFCRCMNV